GSGALVRMKRAAGPLPASAGGNARLTATPELPPTKPAYVATNFAIPGFASNELGNPPRNAACAGVPLNVIAPAGAPNSRETSKITNPKLSAPIVEKPDSCRLVVSNEKKKNVLSLTIGPLSVAPGCTRVYAG